MKIRYAKKSEKEIAIKFWKDSFKDSEEQIKFYFDNIYNEKNYLVLEDNSKIVSSLHENDYTFNFNSYLATLWKFRIASKIYFSNST